MEENKRVYIGDIDYLYLKESPEYERLEGGAVYVFIRAFDVREAIALLQDDMKTKHLEVREIVSMSPYDINQEWGSEEERTHYLYLYTECEKVNSIVYDDFVAYERSE